MGSAFGNGFPFSTRFSSAGVRSRTETARPKSFSIRFSIVAAEGFDPSKTTLPLLMYVTTSSKPSASNVAFSSAMEIVDLPPTLIPRRRATCLLTP